MKESNLYIGTLSGTSADSIDAALFDLGKKIKVIGSLSKKIPQNLKSKIINLLNKKLVLILLTIIPQHYLIEVKNIFLKKLRVIF